MLSQLVNRVSILFISKVLSRVFKEEQRLTTATMTSHSADTSVSIKRIKTLNWVYFLKDYCAVIWVCVIGFPWSVFQ